MVVNMPILNRYIFRWLLKQDMVCWEVTNTGSLFHSTDAAVAKPCLPITFLGRIEGTDSLFP